MMAKASELPILAFATPMAFLLDRRTELRAARQERLLKPMRMR